MDKFAKVNRLIWFIVFVLAVGSQEIRIRGLERQLATQITINESVIKSIESLTIITTKYYNRAKQLGLEEHYGIQIVESNGQAVQDKDRGGPR